MEAGGKESQVGDPRRPECLCLTRTGLPGALGGRIETLPLK